MNKFIIAIVFAFTAAFAVAQKGEYRDHMVEGNLLLLENNFSRAMHEFMKAYAIDSTNANINFKIGFCYLKHPSEKHLAEHYLEKAVKDVTKKYDEDDPMMKSAPPMAYFYLGQAFHLDYKFEDAIKMYETYESFLNPKRFKDEIELVAHYKQMSHTAMEKVATPFNVEITNMGDSINSEAPELSPIISADERMMIFTYSGKKTTGAEDGYRTPEDRFFEDIFVSFKKDDGTWSDAKSISENVNTVGHDGAVAISPDGQTLIIYKDENGDGNLWFSTWDGTDWTRPKRFGPEINSQSWEPSACISADGNTIYFVSDRPGGFGGRDIYRCRKITGDKWSQPQNLGPKINTKYDEESPWLHPNGTDFFFSSQGHNSMGGFDVMFTTLDSAGGFTEVIGMPYPINTTDDDDFYVMSTDGKRAYYSSAHEDRSGFGEQDIYMITLSHTLEEEDRVVLFVGKFEVEKGDTLPEGLTVVVTNKASADQVGIFRPQRNGNFTAILQPKNTYIFSYQLNGQEFYREEITASDEVTFQEIDREIPLKPVKISQDVISPQPKYMLSVTVLSSQKEKEPVTDATIEITDKNGDTKTASTNGSGRITKFELQENNAYKIVAKKDGKYSETVKFTTGDAEKADAIDKTLYLTKGTSTVVATTTTTTTSTTTTTTTTSTTNTTTATSDDVVITLDLIVLDRKSYKPVGGANVTITDDAGQSSNVTTGDDGKSKDIELEPGKTYKIVVTQGELSGKEITVSTKGIKGKRKLTKTLYTPGAAPTETYNVYSPVSGSFKHHFEYNKIEVEQNPNYQQFLADIDKAIAANGTVTIKIISSASQVPTKFEGGNRGLAKSRAENLKKSLSDYLQAKGVDLAKVDFQVKYKVGGPVYNSDYLINKRTYEKYQYVQATLK